MEGGRRGSLCFQSFFWDTPLNHIIGLGYNQSLAEQTEGEGQIHGTFLVRLYDLVIPLVGILLPSRRQANLSGYIE